MKAIILLLGILFITNSNGQQYDCTSKTKTYQELLEAKKFTESFEIWNDVRKNCPKENNVIYTDGVQILQYKIDNASTAEEKEKLVRDVLKLYDQYYKNFPLLAADYEVSKGMTLVDNKIDSKEEIFNLLDTGFSKAAASVTSANAIYTYFVLYLEKFKLGDTKITSNSVLDKYTLVNSLLLQLQNAHPEQKEYTTAHRAINKQIKELATCENLSDFYNKNFEANKENSEWLTAALINLSGQCASKPIFLSLAERLYSIKTTAESANFMALANINQRKIPEAIKFYNESAELQTNPIEKAKIYYTLASGLESGDPSKSKELLNKALALDPKMGKAYLFLAQLYTNNAADCGKTNFEKKAIVYLAIETNKKAAIAEPRLKPTADKINEGLTSKSLTPAEISKEKKNGKSLTIGCWINETITFPAK